MSALLKKPVRRLARRIRDAFRMEALEPRVLLSADPVLGAAQTVLVPDERHDQALVQAYDFPDAAQAADVSGAAQLADFGNLVSPELFQQIRSDQAALRKASLAQTFSVDATVFDLAQLAQRTGFMESELTVAANEALKGSGTMNVSLLNTGLVSPGYSPGMQSFQSFVQTGNATLQIEIGGSAPGTGYDQIKVENTATLDGTLAVKLLDGFKPTDGQVFDVLTFGALQGSFANATGLLDAGNGLYFEVRTTDRALQLVAHQLDVSTAFIVDVLHDGAGAQADSLADRMGLWLNFDYFKNNSSFAFTGSLDLGSGLKLTGTFSTAYNVDVAIGGHDYAMWKVGLADGTGYLGLDSLDPGKPGVSFADVDFGLLLLDDNTLGSDLGYVLGTGQAGGINLFGTSQLSFSAQTLTLDFALGTGTLAGGAPNDAIIDLSAYAQSVTVAGTTYVFNADGQLGEHASASGDVTLVVGPVTLEGTLGVAVSASSLVLAGGDVSAHFSAGGVEVGLDRASFGLVLLSDGTLALEATGSFALDGGNFADVSAQAALLKLNTTGADQSDRLLTSGGFQYRFGQLSASSAPVVNVTGLKALVGGSLAVSGNFAFERDATSGALEMNSSSASVSLLAGSLGAGVQDASVGLVLDGANGLVVEAQGALSANLGEDVSASAGRASVRWNTTSSDAGGRSIDVAGAAYTFGDGLSAGLQEVALSDALLRTAGFFSVRGDFAFHRGSTTVRLAHDVAGTPEDESAGVLVDLLTLGGRGLSAMAGLDGGPALSLAGVEFGLALMASRQDANRTWTTLQASASSASLQGVDALTATGTNLSVAVNRVGKAGDAVVDYAVGHTSLSVGTGVNQALALSLDGAQGALVRAGGDLTIAATDFVQLSGRIDFSVQGQGAGQQLVAVSTSVTAELNAGSAASLKLSSANFGLRADAVGVAAFELGGGTLEASIGGFASLSADAVQVRYAGVGGGVSAGEQLQVGTTSYTFADAIAA
ncbi:LEPR-XLL domain-containing protein, partial [Azohydromonas australica]|uniref:LEPR-XLL domain-containing protein n=1 Tax=Azohydromonas australica TaxID=364039 RepID=UPI00146E0F19